MRRSSRLTLAAAAVFVAFSVAASAQAAPSLVTLRGKVGPGFVITLKKAGKRVTQLPAGRYKFIIEDVSTIHNFHLTGPGVNRATSVSRIVTVTWTLNLVPGRYRAKCDPHASTMKLSFRVT